MRIVGVGWEKPNETPGSFILMDDTHNNPNLIININGVNGAAFIESDHEFNGVIRLRALETNGNNAFRSCQITLYFRPFGNFDFTLNAIPFGGNAEGQFLLRVQGHIRTPLDSNGGFIGTQFVVPAPMRLYRVGYQKRSLFSAQLQVLKNGQVLEGGTCTLTDASGLVDFAAPANSHSRQLNAGDVIQLLIDMYRDTLSLSCVVTLYTSHGTRVIF
jgi:hypothetical protein